MAVFILECKYLIAQTCKLFLGGDVEHAYFVHDNLAAAGSELIFDLLDALPAPAIGSEGECLASLRCKPLHVAEEAADGREHLVVERW